MVHPGPPSKSSKARLGVGPVQPEGTGLVKGAEECVLVAMLPSLRGTNQSCLLSSATFCSLPFGMTSQNRAGYLLMGSGIIPGAGQSR